MQGDLLELPYHSQDLRGSLRPTGGFFQHRIVHEVAGGGADRGGDCAPRVIDRIFAARQRLALRAETAAGGDAKEIAQRTLSFAAADSAVIDESLSAPDDCRRGVELDRHVGGFRPEAAVDADQNGERCIGRRDRAEHARVGGGRQSQSAILAGDGEGEEAGIGERADHRLGDRLGGVEGRRVNQVTLDTPEVTDETGDHARFVGVANIERLRIGEQDIAIDRAGE